MLKENFIKNSVLKEIPKFETHIAIYLMACKTTLQNLFTKKEFVVRTPDEVVVVWANTTASLHDTRCKLTVFNEEKSFIRIKDVRVSEVLVCVLYGRSNFWLIFE